MGSTVKLAAIAAIAVAIGVGIGPHLRSGNEVSSDPSPSPTPAALLAPYCFNGGSGRERLEPGRYITPGPGFDCTQPTPGWPDKMVSIFVPEGWIHNSQGKNGGFYWPAGPDRLAFVALGVVESVVADLCDAESPQPLGQTVDDLTVALEAIDVPGVQITRPEAVELDGYAGTRLDLTVPTSPPDCEFYTLMLTPDTNNGVWEFHSPAGWTHRIWILDVDGVRFMVDASHAPDAPPEIVAEQEQMVHSIDFFEISVPAGPAASPTLAVRLPPYCFSGSWSYEQLEPARYDMSSEWDCSTPAGWPDSRVSMFVPDGWILYGPGKSGGVHHSVVDARIKLGVVGNATVDLCSAGASIPLGPTVDDLIAALASADVTGESAGFWPNITIGGRDGKRIDLAIPITPPDCPSHTVIVTTPMAGEVWSLESPPDRYHQIWILDVDGVRFLVDASFAADISPEVYAELDQIVHSIDFAP